MRLVFGMEGLPGWNGERLRLTIDLNLLTDDTKGIDWIRWPGTSIGADVPLSKCGMRHWSG